MTKTGTCMPR